MRSACWSGSTSSSPPPPAEAGGRVLAVGIEDWSGWAYSWFRSGCHGPEEHVRNGRPHGCCRQGLIQAGGALRSLHADLAEGFTALRALPLARSVIWVGISWGLIGGAYNVLLAVYVTNDLHGDGLLLGVFYVVDGAAVILGSVLAVRLRRGSHLAAYALAYVLQGAAWGAMFLGGQPAWGAALLAVMRTASAVIIALDTTILLSTAPERLRGRITSLHMTTYGAASRVALELACPPVSTAAVATQKSAAVHPSCQRLTAFIERSSKLVCHPHDFALTPMTEHSERT